MPDYLIGDPAYPAVTLMRKLCSIIYRDLLGILSSVRVDD